MLANVSEYATPVELSPGGIDNVGDIGPIKALPARHEKLRDQQFFGGQQAHRDTKNTAGMGMLNP